MRDEDVTTDETHRADDHSDSFFPRVGSAFPFGLSALSRENTGAASGDAIDEPAATTENEPTDSSEDDGSWWDEGLISLLLVVGVVLFIFPEPATSALGILFVSAGVIAWLVDWAL